MLKEVRLGHQHISFDDGPNCCTQKPLNYLGTKNILATFFIVGSHIVEHPAVLMEEYMADEISVHTLVASPAKVLLISLTNEQIIAELG
jgi:hypothetical protein